MKPIRANHGDEGEVLIVTILQDRRDYTLVAVYIGRDGNLYSDNANNFTNCAIKCGKKEGSK